MNAFNLHLLVEGALSEPGAGLSAVPVEGVAAFGQADHGLLTEPGVASEKVVCDVGDRSYRHQMPQCRWSPGLPSSDVLQSAI